MSKLKVNMYAGGLDIEGQGVGANFFEQVKIIQGLDDFEVSINGKNPKKYDINHFHTVNPSFFFKFRKKKINICYVHFIPEIDDGSLKLPKWCFKPYRWYVLKFYRKADEVVVVNPYFKKDLLNINIPEDKITYIPNSVSDKEFHPLNKEMKDKIRDEFKIDKNKFVVLGVGQTQTRKGIIDFYKVALKNPDIQFVWAGGFSFGKITAGYDEIKKIIDNPPENLKFLGIVERKRMNEIFNMADMLFLPSYQELFPMTLLECVNAELPFLVRDLDLYKDIFLSHYLVGHDNDEFSSLINRLKDDKDFYNEIKEDSLKLKEFYSVKNVAKLWDRYYKDIYNKYPNKH
ncbi:MAG: glycosyltransferase family 4 protein [bacterium]|nr:glycosyltransferase family 4 protein [bacterium]